MVFQHRKPVGSLLFENIPHHNAQSAGRRQRRPWRQRLVNGARKDSLNWLTCNIPHCISSFRHAIRLLPINMKTGDEDSPTMN
jgi:hypothetical protein